MRINPPSVAVVLVALAMVCLSQARSQAPTTDMPPSGPTDRLDIAQLDQLTAPIALYPDPLLGSILAAATYPLEVVEAARWLEKSAHAGLKGDELVAALEQQSWDPSVKSLVAFPDVLRMMNSNLEWTEKIGDAFLAQQADVMDSVQRLRQRAAAAGAFQAAPQQTVATQQDTITVEPASPEVIYVPCYVPAVVFAPWPWPGYSPYYFATPDLGCGGAGLIGFGIGISILGPYWGWYRWDWPGHGLMVLPRHPRPGRPVREPDLAARPWQHDPAHRGGVPYRDAGTAARYLGSDAAARRPFRGFPPAPVEAPSAIRPPAPGGAAPPMPQSPRPAAPRPAPPAFESFGRGQQVRGEAARGASSRSMAAPGLHGGGGAPGHR